MHINLLSLILLSLVPFFSNFTSLTTLACFIISMSVTHTFLDPLPSIFLGAPDSDTALGVLPGHRYLLKGHGLMAVKLTALGSFGALIISIAIFPLLLYFLKPLYGFVEDYIGMVLIIVVIFMILRDNKKLWAFLVFLMSGTLGILVLSYPALDNPLFPMLSGLFGVSTLLISLNSDSALPKQKIQKRTEVRPSLTTKALLSGQFSGFLTAILPGVGAGTAAILSLQITRDLGDRGFLILMGSINTVNFILSIAALYVLGKPRNGAVVAVKEMLGSLSLDSAVIFLFVSLISGALAFILAIRIGKLFAGYIYRVDYRKLVISVVLFILLLTFLMTGFRGILVLVVSTAVGAVPAIVKVARVNSMACLLLPVITYFTL
ncbi:MAG: tripartite tricarboxylate transporter permease [Nanobdellota archaeon]